MEESSQDWEDYVTWRDRNENEDPNLKSNPNDDIIQMYTSGTTGYPKGVQLTNKNFVEAQKTVLQVWGKDWHEGSVNLICSPIFHAAGANTEKTDRIANLLQISSAFGKAMESVDRVKMTKLIYPVLLEKKKKNQLREEEVRTIGASVTESYSFPTNLDTDSPTEGSVPETSQSLMERALSNKWPVEKFCLKLDEAVKRRLPSKFQHDHMNSY